MQGRGARCGGNDAVNAWSPRVGGGGSPFGIRRYRHSLLKVHSRSRASGDTDSTQGSHQLRLSKHISSYKSEQG